MPSTTVAEAIRAVVVAAHLAVAGAVTQAVVRHLAAAGTAIRVGAALRLAAGAALTSRPV